MTEYWEIRAMLLGNEFGLTDRDVEWLRALSQGAQPKELQGGLSRNAVTNRLDKVRKAMGAKTTAQAVAIAVKKELI